MKIGLNIILGIIITVIGILGIVIFLCLAYKTANEPIEDKKAKLFGITYGNKRMGIKKITDLLSYNSKSSEINEFVNKESVQLHIEDETAFLNLSYDTEILENDETELLSDETELLHA